MSAPAPFFSLLGAIQNSFVWTDIFCLVRGFYVNPPMVHGLPSPGPGPRLHEKWIFCRASWVHIQADTSSWCRLQARNVYIPSSGFQLSYACKPAFANIYQRGFDQGEYLFRRVCRKFDLREAVHQDQTLCPRFELAAGRSLLLEDNVNDPIGPAIPEQVILLSIHLDKSNQDGISVAQSAC